MRILLTGATGKLGKCLGNYLTTMGYEVIPVDIRAHGAIIHADLQNEVKVSQLIETHAPDLIIHLAAITDIGFCEQNKEKAHAVNFGITEILVRLCQKFSIQIVYFSSDYVFGAKDLLWEVQDNPCPTTQYGKDKAACERIIQEHLVRYVIVRTAQLYGFSGDFVDMVRSHLTTGRNFMAFANLVNCPTWTGDLFPMLVQIIEQKLYGIFHCVGPEALSRYQYACTIAEYFALRPAFIQPVYLDFSKDIRPPIVRLGGLLTNRKLQIHPGRLKDNLAMHHATF